MMKKDIYLLIDTETTTNNLVVDFGAIVVNRKGEILHQCAILINGIFGVSSLWYDTTNSTGIWSKQGTDKRMTKYNTMLDNGSRMIASVNGINRWLERVKGKYNPILTAYNLPFDMNKCDNTGIDLTMFDQRFDLWTASFNRWALTNKYKNFALENHAFNNRTQLGNMTYQTNAEIMAKFITQENLEDEPHTALEDLIGYELPILNKLINTTTKEDFMNPSQGFDWRKVQLKDNFKSA
jgi:hypothetical protein|tara:strand:+ start:334 stop:1047 length:714 start_codon:yes stop_codon:yes gene_type:complete